MSENNAELQEVIIEERATLNKFEGEPLPENLTESITIVDGDVVQHNFYENGELVASYDSLQGGDE